MGRIAVEGMQSVEYCTMFRPKSHGKRNTRVYAMSCNEVYNYVGYHEKNSYVCHMYHSFIICKKRKMVHNEKKIIDRGFYVWILR